MSTTIEWTDETWNPTRGCSRVSEGCRNCYAERIAARFSRPKEFRTHGIKSGTFGGYAIQTVSGPRWTGKVELIESKLTEPLHWKKPRRVFVDSMSDLFHEALPDEAIDRVFAVMALCPQQTFQVLTKRANRMLTYLSHPLRDVNWRTLMRRDHGHAVDAIRMRWPLPNVWLGVSVEDQATADDRIPKLLQTPAAVRFVSYEPALKPVDFANYLPGPIDTHRSDIPLWPSYLNWVIVGGESGPGAWPFDIEWGRKTIRQCKAAGVPVFVKQVGSKPVPQLEIWQPADHDSKGGNWDEWPADLRVREFPR